MDIDLLLVENYNKSNTPHHETTHQYCPVILLQIVISHYLLLHLFERRSPAKSSWKSGLRSQLFWIYDSLLSIRKSWSQARDC